MPSESISVNKTPRARVFDAGLTESAATAAYAQLDLLSQDPLRPRTLADVRLEGAGDEQEWDFRHKKRVCRSDSPGGMAGDHTEQPENLQGRDEANLDIRCLPKASAVHGFARTRTPQIARDRMLKRAEFMTPQSVVPISSWTPPVEESPLAAKVGLTGLTTRRRSPRLQLEDLTPSKQVMAIKALGTRQTAEPPFRTPMRHAMATSIAPSPTPVSRRCSARHSLPLAPESTTKKVVTYAVNTDGPSDFGSTDASDSDEKDDDAMVSRYFEDQTQSVTSDNTLASLPKLSHRDYLEMVSKLPEGHTEGIEQLMRFHRHCFAQWLFELSQGFNLLLFGFGSKHGLLEEFAESMLRSTHDVVKVAGYHPLVNLKAILTALSTALECPSPAHVHDHLNSICSAIREQYSPQEPLIVLLHNVDSPNLRHNKVQSTLSMLASETCVRLIASADHINSMILWDYLKLSRFNWLPHHVTTFNHFTVETSLEHTLMVKPGSATPQSALAVLASLPHNSRECFRLLARHLLEVAVNENFPANVPVPPELGLAYTKLFSMCREAFLVSEESNFRTILTEFKDHHAILGRRIDGVETLTIPLPASSIEMVLESMPAT